MSEAQSATHVKRQRIFWLVLTGLFILRIPFFAGLDLFEIRWRWTEPIYEIGTLALTMFLVWWSLDHLADYNVDTLVLLIIIIFAPVQTLILKYWGLEHPLAFPSIPSLIIWLLSVIFAAAMWRKRSKLARVKLTSLAWFFIGGLAGLGISVLLSYPFSLQISAEELSHGLSAKETLANIPLSFIYQIGYAAVPEEPLFRGFLWGGLEKSNWRGVWIWLFQAVLFTMAHIYTLPVYPLSFWVIIPVFSLVLGWLAWRSRTVASSMAAHGIMNATGYAFAYLAALNGVR